MNMDNKTPVILERNPVTHQQHRKDVLRQITIPLVIGCLTIVIVGGLVIWGSAVGGEHERWAGISLIWLITPTLIMSLFFLIILAGFVYLITLALVKLPPFARQVQDFFVLAKYQVMQLDDKIIEPFLRAHEYKASAQKLGRKLRRKS